MRPGEGVVNEPSGSWLEAGVAGAPITSATKKTDKAKPRAIDEACLRQISKKLATLGLPLVRHFYPSRNSPYSSDATQRVWALSKALDDLLPHIALPPAPEHKLGLGVSQAQASSVTSSNGACLTRRERLRITKLHCVEVLLSSDIRTHEINLQTRAVLYLIECGALRPTFKVGENPENDRILHALMSRYMSVRNLNNKYRKLILLSGKSALTREKSAVFRGPLLEHLINECRRLEHRYLTIFTALLGFGANANARLCSSRETPLHLAARAPFLVPFARQLLAKGAEKNLQLVRLKWRNANASNAGFTSEPESQAELPSGFTLRLGASPHTIAQRINNEPVLALLDQDAN